MISLENDVIATRFDSVRQVCIYVLAQGERRWTVEVPLPELHKHAGNKMLRRKTVENALHAAMSGPDDATKRDAETLRLDSGPAGSL